MPAGGLGTGRRLWRGKAPVKCQDSDTLRSKMKKKVCMILVPETLAVTKRTPWEELRVEQAMTDERSSVVYAPKDDRLARRGEMFVEIAV